MNPEGATGQAGGGVSWAEWPEAMAEQARTVRSCVESSNPSEALDLLDAMIADLDSRRGIVADLANENRAAPTDD